MKSRTASTTEYSSVLPGNGSPVFQFSQMEKLLRGRAVRSVTVDGADAIFVNDPVLVRQILVTDHKKYGRSELFQKGRNISNIGILADDETVHRRYRRLANPLLRAAKVNEYLPVMHNIAHHGVTSWTAGQPLNIQAEMCRIAGAIAARALLPGLSRETSAALSDRLAVMTWATIRRPIHGKAAARARRPGPASKRLARARADVRDIVISGTADLQRAPGSATDYLAALLADSDERGDRVLTVDQVCDEAILMLSAATVTTASVMSWALYLLSAEPLIEKKLSEDLATAENGSAVRGNESCPAGYTVRFLMEVLRLYPPIWIHCRKARTSVTLGDFSLPEGANVIFSPYLLHRDPDRYPDPYHIDPDRWLSWPGADDTLYIPFGLGPKGCIGEPFAWQELEVILGAVTRKWTLTTKPGRQVRAAAETMLHPRQLLMIPQPR